jgi:hypothetical protein
LVWYLPGHEIWRPALLTVLIHLALIAVYVAKRDGNISTLVCVEEYRVGTSPFEAVTDAVGKVGYDGQFYYLIARHPWQIHQNGLIDAPGIRQLRIFYPALCWLVSGGNDRVLLWVMPAVNLVALGALAALGAAFARHQGLSFWWGLLLPMAVNAGMPAFRDLTDPVSTLAIFGLFAGWLLGWGAPVLGLWAAMAVFTREQNILFVLVVLLAAILKRRLKVTAVLAIVLLAWLVWVGVLRLMYGTWPFLSAQGHFGLPFLGMIHRWTYLGGSPGFSRRRALVHAMTIVHLLLQAGIAVYLALRREESSLTMFLLLGAGLVVCGGVSIYEDYWSYMRVFACLPLAIWLGSIATRQLKYLCWLLPNSLWTLVAITLWV